MESLEILSRKLAETEPLADRLEILEQSERFARNLPFSRALQGAFNEGTLNEKVIIASVVAIGQAQNVFYALDLEDYEPIKFRNLLAALWNVEDFYHEIGGIVGYHAAVLRLLEEQKQGQRGKSEEKMLKPPGHDLSQTGKEQNAWIRMGVESLPRMAEIYPVGGAGDRLDLRDESSGDPLPAAELQFGGKSLLASLLRDLQAKEYLFYKLTDSQVRVPVVMMTSEEKDNHRRILDICERNDWFGRSEEDFFFMMQPMVPVITASGHWSMSGPYELTTKPGGHGVIWKLALETGAFEWLSRKNRSKALLRQINNPVAGTDSVVLAFCGLGMEQDKAFGFASCPRLLNTAQGMLVLFEKAIDRAFEYRISNVEYTDFAKRGLEDVPEEPESTYSKFPANTNILFADLGAVKEALVQCPIPGMLVNFKSRVPYRTSEGQTAYEKGGRLESTMQNISDCITEKSDHALGEEEFLSLNGFVTYSERRKTISVTKKSYDPEKGACSETPVGCFYEVLQNNHELLFRHCGVKTPLFCEQSTYLSEGPNVLFLYHPALGPLYSVIAQKIRGGRLFPGAEWQMEIAEADIENIQLDGSLLIHADDPLGHLEKGRVRYSDLAGKCQLKNVKIQNQGIDRSKTADYWKNAIVRKESLTVVLHGNAEFCAENVEFYGSHTFEVPEGCRWTAVQEGDGIVVKKEKISASGWRWDYSFAEDNSIRLQKK